MSFVFNELGYRPLYNLLIFVYNVFPLADFGIAIIIVTIIIKIILIPLSRKQIESQKKMQELQPRIKEIQEKHKNDKEKQSRAMLELYKEKKTNPLSGCLPMIVQLIFLIAIYRILFNISQSGLIVEANNLYSFISNPGQINHSFLGIIDLSATLSLSHLTIGNIPHLILILLAAGSQYFQTKMLMAKQPKAQKNAKGGDFSQMMTQQMLYLGPLLTLFIGFKFPAGLSLYWLVSTGFMIVQQYQLEKKEKKLAKKDNY